MPKKFKEVPGEATAVNGENLESDRSVESAETVEIPDRREAAERAREGELSSAQSIRERLLSTDTAMIPSAGATAAAYLEKNLPERFREQQFFAGAHQKVTEIIFGLFEAFGLFKIKGHENVPVSGACVMISNHTRVFDGHKHLALLRRPAHIIGADMHFDMNIIYRWYMNAVGAIEVKSTLRNLSEEEKVELLKRTPSGARSYYARVIERDRNPANRDMLRSHRETLQSTVAVLLKGEPVILFPEGLWLYEGGKMRRAYGGIEHIAREYHRLTGKDLPIVPVGITKGSATAGEPVTLSKGQNVHDIMKKVAKLLPEDERGYYAEKTV